MTATAAPPQHRSVPEPASGVFTHRQILTIFGGLMLGILLAALDQTIVSTAIRTIADDLHGLNQQAWATTAYLITSTISTPLYGKLSDLYGRRPFFLTAISIFIGGSVLCTISTSMYELAAFRAVQGLGAGGLMSLAFAIIGDIVPPRERARYQNYFLATFGAASVIGPLVGGAFAGAHSILGIAGWRWVFLVNVPVAAAALFVVARVLNIPHTPREHRIDWLGAVALTIAVVPVLLVAEQGQGWGWDSVRAVVCYVIATAGLIGFLTAERGIGDDALIPLQLFRNGVFSVTSAASLIIGTGMFGGFVLMPQYLQIVKGATPTKSGLLLLPLMAGIIVGSVLSGRLTSRTGRYKILPVLGTAVMAVALLLLHFRLGVDTSLGEVDVYMGLFGLGLGGCLQTLVMAAQNAVPARDMGVATASATFFRQMGGTLGVAVFLSILFSTAGSKIADAFRAIGRTPEFQSALADPAVRANPANDVVLQAVRTGGVSGSGNAGGVLQDSSFLQHIDARLARPFLVGFSNAMDGVFLVAAGVMIIAFVLILFLKEVPLRTQSGIEALAAEFAAESGEAPRSGVRDSGVRDSGVPDSRVPESGETLPAPPVGVPNPASAGHRPGPVIHGQVTRSGHTPLAGVALTLTDLSGRQLDRDYSDSGGHYRLEPPGGGSYLVICASTAHQPGIALVAVADAPVRHDFMLAGAGASLSGMVYTAEPGQLIAGAVVTLIDICGDVVVTTTTGPDGRFAFLGLAQGLYTLTVAASAVHPVARTVEVPAHGDLTQDVEVRARAQLVGSVRTASAGAPVPEALATLLDSEGHVIGAAITGVDGEFVFDDLQAGAYTVTAAGYPPVATEVHLGLGAPTETVITLRPATLADAAAGNGALGGGAHREGHRHGYR
ncbi:MAG: MFS transporter [Pseudonocardiales bacterium]|nr:MFS transporter [Pseudonocardiales bacterium]MBV9032101.1 MFS transporter [Pseudonocardiales bacterium]